MTTKEVFGVWLRTRLSQNAPGTRRPPPPPHNESQCFLPRLKGLTSAAFQKKKKRRNKLRLLLGFIYTTSRNTRGALYRIHTRLAVCLLWLHPGGVWVGRRGGGVSRMTFCQTCFRDDHRKSGLRSSPLTHITPPEPAFKMKKQPLHFGTCFLQNTKNFRKPSVHTHRGLVY